MTPDRSRDLAVGWIEAWMRMDLAWLRRHLAPDFVHNSPFGRLEGRDAYLAAVEPMARTTVQALRILDVVASGDQAVIRFENHTPGGVVESCDWLWTEGDLIREISSYYDPARVREALSPGDRDRLGGASDP